MQLHAATLRMTEMMLKMVSPSLSTWARAVIVTFNTLLFSGNETWYIADEMRMDGQRKVLVQRSAVRIKSRRE